MSEILLKFNLRKIIVNENKYGYWILRHNFVFVVDWGEVSEEVNPQSCENRRKTILAGFYSDI